MNDLKEELIFDLKEKDKIFKTNKMFLFVLYKKEIHLMFDSICDYNIILDVFKNLEHLLIKKVILNYENIEEILDGKLIDFYEEKIQKFTLHFENCPVI